MNNDMTKQDVNYTKVADLYNKLARVARTFKDESKAGNANWSASEIKGTELIKYMQYDGGYSSKLISMTYGFVIWEKYDDTDGTVFRFDTGTITDMENCVDEITKEL